MESARRPLPTDPGERDQALQINDLPAGMIVSAVSSVMQAADVKPLSAVEKSEGRMAFSALLYEYGAQLSAAVLVAMWAVSIITPRLIEFFEKRKAEAQKSAKAAEQSVSQQLRQEQASRAAEAAKLAAS